MKGDKKKYRKAVFIVAYSIIKNKIYYLLLKRKLHWRGWEFPKGKIEFLECKKRTVKRELKEETGLIPIKIKKFDIKGKYSYNKILPDRPGYIGQTYHLFIAEVKKEKVFLDTKEHSDYKWLPFKEAYKKLNWPNQKHCLKIADKTLYGY